MLDAEFVYLSLPENRENPMIEVARTRKQPAGDSLSAIRATLASALPPHPSEQTGVVIDMVGHGNLRIASAPIGFGDDALLIAAAQRGDFPTEAQRLLLGIAANETTIALQRWNAEAHERRFSTLVESSSDFIAFASLGGVPQYVNAAGLQLIGLASMEEARRTTLVDLVMPREQARLRDQLWPRVLREGQWVGEIGFRHFVTGAEIPFLVDLVRIDDPRTGRPMNVAAVNRDLTSQKRSEAELRHLNETLEQRVARRTSELNDANQQLIEEIKERELADARLQELQLELFHAARLSAAGQMAATLAHELNQPLTAATNSVHAARRLIAKGEPKNIDTAREVMAEAAEQALRAAQIIRRLREFVTRGETEMRTESVKEMVEEARAFALAGADASGVEVRFCFDPKVATIFANRIQVQQVLVNIMRNALEAMAGAPRRELIVSTTLPIRDAVEVAIADSGPGLAADVAEHLFDPFVSTKRDGMGLGLSICRSIVEAHGGQLWAEPNPDGGAIFRFTLSVDPTLRESNAD
jgi:PAS domain S-box-containing protein